MQVLNLSPNLPIIDNPTRIQVISTCVLSVGVDTAWINFVFQDFDFTRQDWITVSITTSVSFVRKDGKIIIKDFPKNTLRNIPPKLQFDLWTNARKLLNEK